MLPVVAGFALAQIQAPFISLYASWGKIFNVSELQFSPLNKKG